MLLLFFLNAKSQLKIEGKSKPFATRSEADIRKFIALNNFNYALIASYTSPWTSSINSEIYGLIQQESDWYIVKIKNVEPIPTKLGFHLMQRKLDNAEIDSIWHKLDPESAFKYNQEDFDKLPESCQYMENGKHKGLLSVYDAATYHLVQLSNKEIKTLNFYAPDVYVERCYPHFQEYGILKGFMNTAGRLSKLTEKLKD